MLSLKVSKYNKYNWVQERNLVVTQDYIYNFKHKSNLVISIFETPFRIAKIFVDIWSTRNYQELAHEFKGGCFALLRQS